MTADRTAVARVVFGAVVISTAPVLVGAVDPSSLGTTAVGAYRNLLAVPFLVLLALWRGERPDRRILLAGVLLGLMFAFNLTVWHQSIQRIGAGLSTVLGNTQVVWVSLYGVLVLGEPKGPRLVVSIVLALLGVTLISGVLAPDGAPTADLTGVLLGVLTSFTFAAFLIGLRLRPPGAPASFMVSLSATAALGMFLGAILLGERLVPADAATWGIVFALAILAQSVGWLTLATWMPRIPASAGALLILLQPVLSILWAALFLGERLTTTEAVGSVLVLAAIYLGASRGRLPE